MTAVYISEEVYRKAEVRAAAEGRPLDEFATEALKQYMEASGKNTLPFPTIKGPNPLNITCDDIKEEIIRADLERM